MDSIAIGIAWCVAWGDRREPQFAIGVLQEMRQALCRKGGFPIRCNNWGDQMGRSDGYLQDKTLW